ncbi:MAG: outer membrane protein assembly factor BamB family protein [Planctomycetota bacterium]
MSSQPPVTFPEMLQALARQGATGVLTVQGPEGWKVLEVQAGSVSLVSGVSGKRLRIGEILQARGKISHEVLAKALATQRVAGGPLGEILIQRGFITQQELDDIVHFQLEEEIYDIFTWRGAECTFEPGATIGEQMAEYPHVANLAADAQQIFVEAAQRIPIWQQVEKTIYSSYMTFRLTERGATMLETATRSGRRLLELVQQQYCVDTLVLKAMVGRFAIWKALADLVNAQAITAVPDAELPDLANRWEGEGKLEQACGAYLRLAETTTDARRIDELKRRAEALREQLLAAEEQALLRAEQAGELDKASSRYRTTVILLAVLAVAVMALVLAPALKLTGRASGEDMEAWKRASRKAQEFREEGDLAGAMDLWDDFLAERPEGTVADLAGEARQIVREDYEKLVEEEIKRARELVGRDKFTEALDLYRSIPVRYPRTRKQVLLSELIRTAEKRRDAYTKALEYEELAEMLESGLKMLQQKRYGEAKEALQTVIKSQSAGPQLRQRAREGMKVVDQVEAKAEELVKAAQAKEKAGRLDDAIDIYGECAEMWFTSTWGQEAARRKTVLGRRRTRAERLYREGVRFSEKGDTIGAQRQLREAAGYKGYRAAELAARKLEDMASERERVAELLEREKRLREEGKLDEAFGVIAEIAERFPRSAARLNLKLEISIETVPSSARVFLGSQELGRSPITTRISPKQSGVLLLRKPGFVSLKEKFERARTRVMRFHLQKEIAYRLPLEEAVFSAAALGKPADERARPLMFVQSGSSLVAFIPNTGKKLWQVEPGEAPVRRVGPAVLDETVYVVGGDRLRGYSPGGTQRLDIPVGGTAATSPVPVRLRLLANRTFVVLACADGTVASFDVLSRERRWSGRVNTPVDFDLAANEKAVFVPSGGDGIVALSILDGRPVWKAPIPGEAGGDITIGPKGESVGVVTSLGEAYVLSAADGQVRMRAPLDRARGGAMVLTEHTAFVGTDDGRLRAVDIATSTVKWSVAVEGAVRAAPTLHGGDVYVGTEDGRIVCVSAQAGRIEWSFDAEAPVTASGGVCEDMIIFGTHDGEIIGIDVGKRIR